MLATDKFVFGHLPRSGGTFISDVIKSFSLQLTRLVIICQGSCYPESILISRCLGRFEILGNFMCHCIFTFGPNTRRASWLHGWVITGSLILEMASAISSISVLTMSAWMF